MNYNIQRVIAAWALFIASPVLVLTIIVIRILYGSPVFYTDSRLGKNRIPFLCIKFRTMCCSNHIRSLTEQETFELKNYGKIRKDCRVTKFGYFLRRFSLDELPQLWNVVKGDMALIGPRPIVSKEDRIYGRYGDRLHSILPGLTGLWQVSGRCLTTYHRRIAINLYYVRHRSWRLNLWILWRTIGAVIGGKGAF